jgi:hypothetical protein
VNSPGFDRSRPLHASLPAATASVVLSTFTP